MNRASASRFVARIAELGFAPVADWIILSGQWDESKRELGLAVDFGLIEKCDELWLCGPRVSPGMLLEARHARTWGVRVYDYTGVAPEALTYSATDPQWSEVS